MMNPKESQYYTKGILEGNKLILSRTITLIESSLEQHRVLSKKVLDKLMPHTGKSIRVGITGVPGVGKSTFIENLGVDLAEQGHRVAVLTIDPSSNKMGGSILGDKTRMEKLSFHENTFVRPSPSKDILGGVAAKTRESMLVCEAAGFDIIMVETVGVGQSETQVATMVDFFLVLMIAGTGDELQGIKKGVLELADAIVINKSDGKNIPLTKRAKSELSNVVQLLAPVSPHWMPPVLTCSSIMHNGTSKVWEIVLKHQKKMRQTGEFRKRRKKQAVHWMWTLVEEGLKARFKEDETISGLIPDISKEVFQNRISPSKASARLLDCL